MHLTAFLFRIVFSAAVLLLAADASAQEVRKWTDKASGRQIDASMVSADVTKGEVIIQMTTGQQFTLPFARLVDADVEYVKSKMAAPAPAPAAAGATPAPAAPAAPPAAPAKGKGKGKAATTAPVVKGEPAPPPPQFKTIPAKGFKGPGDADFIRGLQRVRPRLIHNAQGWAYLKDLCSKDPAAMKMIETLKKNGELLLNKPEMTRIYLTEAAAVNPGSQMVFRISLLGALHHLDGDPKWKERGIREIMATVDKSFGDWYPAEPLICKDMLISGVLAYDWFRDGYNAEQLKAFREFIKQKGVDPLEAHLKGEPIPESAKKVEPGTVQAKAKAAPKAKPKVDDKDAPITGEDMGVYAALILTGICLADDDAQTAKQALGAVDKNFSKGIQQFAPGGIWPEGLEAGEQVMDNVVLVLQTLRSACGNDFGLSYLEGVPQHGLARLHFSGPGKLLFNYGDSRGSALVRNWVASWLSGLHGNPGHPATFAIPAKSDDAVDKAAFLDLAGLLMYHNPQAAGYGTPASMDYVSAGGEAAALRSAWDDPKAMFIAFKGGNNEVPECQLDIGSFVLDAGGVRWGLELGAEADRAAGFEPAPDRTRRYNLYLEGTKGQNTLVMGGGTDEEDDDDKKKKAAAGSKGAPPPKPPLEPAPGNQELDAKAAMIGFSSTPEKGVAILDMTEAYRKTKIAHRGAMVVRGPQPYVLLQDDLTLKGTVDVDWQMHTKSEITAAGNKATLTQGTNTLTASLLSPEGAQFVVEDPPEAEGEQNRDLRKEKVKVLKVKLPASKGEQRITVVFASGAEAPAVPVVPLSQWLPKK